MVKTFFLRKPWFLLLLPFFFIVHGYNEYFGLLPMKFVFLNWVVSTGVVVILFSLSKLYLNNNRKALLFTFLLSALMFTFGFWHDILKEISWLRFAAKYTVVLPIIFIALLLLIYYIKRINAVPEKTFMFLNVLMGSFFLYEAVICLTNFRNYRNEGYLIDNRFAAYKQFNPGKLLPDTAKPDIFFLIFDGMPSTNAMKKEWNFDNGTLDSFLLKQNFYIKHNSKSNYNLTVLSVSSTFNMNYLPAIDLHGNEIKMYFKASASILDNSLTKILQKQGYAISQFQPISFQNKDWDRKLLFGDMLYKNFYYKTLPGRIYRDLWWNTSKISLDVVQKMNDSRYDKIYREFEENLHYTARLVKQNCTAKREKPIFLYAHFTIPHDPYMFDSTGKRKNSSEIVKTKVTDHPAVFMEQVKFTNQMIKDLVLHIKTSNKKNTIIIIEGDHGFRNIYGDKGYMIFENLNCCYFPDGDYSAMYNTMSPVNTFRTVLNKYFYANIPLLKDSSYFIPYTLPSTKQ
jgi:hypothetical protein